MNNFTTDTYEMKREIVNFSKKIAKDVNKSTKKFISDMQYGISKSGSVLLTDISRALNEKINLKYTVDRLSNNLITITKEEVKQIKENYINEVIDLFPEESIAIFDDSDIAKPYGKKFEDLDEVIDASSLKQEIVSGYHVCEAVILTEKEKQPISVYSEIYSCKSHKFISKNHYTNESIETVRNVLGRKCNMIFDRGYDDNKIINMVDSNGDYFVIRMQDRRMFLFKDKKKKLL